MYLMVKEPSRVLKTSLNDYFSISKSWAQKHTQNPFIKTMFCYPEIQSCFNKNNLSEKNWQRASLQSCHRRWRQQQQQATEATPKRHYRSHKI